MDIIKEFEEEYLPRWSEEKMQPIPTREQSERWYIAWQDFMNEVLTKKYSEVNHFYTNMEYKSERQNNVEIIPMEQFDNTEVTKPEKKKSNWELVMEKRKKSN